jgi:hypothetical protein
VVIVLIHQNTPPRSRTKLVDYAPTYTLLALQ